MDAADASPPDSEVKDIPPVPLKTYHWEDARRAKTKGGYPYTYLYKGDYDGEVDPEQFTMEAFRRSKSASTLPKSDSGVIIREITESAKETKDFLNVSDAHHYEGIVESADSSAEDNISQYLDRDSDEKPEIEEQIDAPGPSKEAMEVDDGDVPKIVVDKVDADKKEERAKSEEPKRKRKLSIESSYSRISLSRLGVMKKLREAKDKIKFPKFSFSKSDSKLAAPKKKSKKGKDDESKATKETLKEAKKVEGPLYIHIPLKPPPGETDEFSHLEFDEVRGDTFKKCTPTTSIKEEPNEEIEKIDDEKGSRTDVQIIFLTAPSDDETLDERVITPDTPSSDGQKFFDNTKIKELKSLAKGAVDELTPGTNIDGIIFEDVIQVEYVDENNRPIGTTEKSKFIEVTEENLPKLEKKLSNRNIFKELQEEIRTSRESLNKLIKKKANGSESPKIVEIIVDVAKLDEAKKAAKLEETKRAKPEETKSATLEETKPKEEGKVKIMIDEEDGLKTSDAPAQVVKIVDASEDAKLVAKDASPLKKKVSFKRKSKQEDPDGIYEDVQVTDGKERGKELKVMDTSQSMSVDEEKSYLDEKIVKTTSLEEDYNKWSKLPDHEYEPVNPPPDDGKSPPQEPAANPDPSKPPAKPEICFDGRSIRIPLHEDVVVVQSDDADSPEILTAAEMQSKIEDRFFNAPAAEQSAVTTTTTTVTAASTAKEEPAESQAKKLQESLRNQAGRIRTKFKNMKRPNISLPQRPNFERFKLEKPRLPKIPDQVKINLPSFTLPKRGAKKRPVKERQLSTESNAGDSKKKIFDFSTYPRIFSKKKKPGDFGDEDAPPAPESSTLPRAKKPSIGSRWAHAFNETKKKQEDPRRAKENEPKRKSPEVIRIPLHSEESMDRRDSDAESASRTRYDEDIDMDDAYLRESQEIHRASPFSSDFSRNRWNHGSFHGENLHEIDRTVKITDLDNETPPSTKKLNVASASSSDDVHRRGVLEEINSDEFFLRQKGISQDDIEMGALLSSEIREAFRQPVNSLSKMQAGDDYDRDFDISDQSFQETPKRKPMKKPKRKKTPHASQEAMPYDRESDLEEYPKTFDAQPPRPKRKSKRKGKDAARETVADDVIAVPKIFQVNRKCASDNVLNDQCEDDRHFYDRGFKDEYPEMYENERMKGIERPNILVSDHQKLFQYADEDEERPAAPPRKQKSLKSLTSEHDSIIDEIAYANQGIPQQNVDTYRMEHEYIIPTPEEPPIKPARNRSRTRSQSRATTQPDDDVEVAEIPCVEEPCVSKLCDYMGYAIIDKSKQREPPLPPPAPRRRRSIRSEKPASETKFFTVPRPLNDATPTRPLRNYSTLAPRSKRSTSNVTDDCKENIDITQYIEMEDDEHSHLQSGVVIQKMKDRPLPAPPRPPRRSKDGTKSPLKDITNEVEVEKLQESEVSVQTEPLPDDFVCEEFVQDKNDKVITPSPDKGRIAQFEHEETVTHGALIVAPVPDNFESGPISSFDRSTERIITIKREVLSDEETSEIPENFAKYKDPPQEIDVLKAQKLQVSDLDVDRLTVNELLASKIKVSEIDSGNICVNEINPKSGNIIISGIELPVGFLQDLIEKFNEARAQSSAAADEANVNIPTVNVINVEGDVLSEDDLKRIDSEDEFKREILEALRQEDVEDEDEEIPMLVPDTSEEERLIDELKTEEQKKTPIDEDLSDPPQRPPRQSDFQRQQPSDVEYPEFWDGEAAPPRPPEPRDVLEQIYLRSQPPPSFYMLRSPVVDGYVDDDDIPLPPRRKRPPKVATQSSSEELPPATRGRRHRTPEPSIPQLTGQLVRACGSAGEKALKRFIKHVTMNVMRNADGQQDLHVVVVILLVLIAGLILLGWGDGHTVHHHHWEYFNPPKNL